MALGLGLGLGHRRPGGWRPGSQFANGEQGFVLGVASAQLYQDSDGTIPVTAVGQPVGKVQDLSGNGNALIQPTATNRPTLQRDESGLLCLDFDGSTSWMYMPELDMSASSAVTVCAGIYREALSAVQVYAELSANTNNNNGAFYMSAPQTSNNVGGLVKGTTSATLAVAETAPDKWVVTVQGNLAAASGTTASLRVNGATGTTSSTVLGGGTFGKYPFYVGARGGSSLWFAGRLYGLVVRGALSSAGEIAQVESWMNRNTGAY